VPVPFISLQGFLAGLVARSQGVGAKIGTRRIDWNPMSFWEKQKEVNFSTEV
jgi:hypothetical protein